MTQRAWEDLIADGEDLKIMEDRVESEAGNVRWLWGDLALEVAPMGRDGVNSGVTERLRQFADELDVSFKTLQMYRTVAERWPAAMRVAAQPWAVHQQIMGREDREELIANPVDVRTGEKVDRWTFRGMQRFLGHKPSPHYIAPPSTVEQKTDLIESLIDDPEVADAVRVLLDAPTSQSLTEDPGRVDKTFDERCSSWVNRLNSLMMEGAKIACEAEESGHVSDTATSHLAVLLYQRLSERQFDLEIRRLLETEGAG